jgi:tetratricopeptide (TPR) repeat protein
MNRPRSRPTALALALLPLAACLGPSEDTQVDEEKVLELYMTTATFLYEDDSLVRAQDQAVKALEIDPDNVPMRLMIGWIRVRMGRPEDLLIAEEFFRELLYENPDDPAAKLGLASTCERLGLAYLEASDSFADGTRVPTEGDALDKAAETRARSTELLLESAELYEAVLAGGGGQVRTMNGLQRVHALLGNHEISLGWSEQLLTASTEELADWRRMLSAEDLTETEERTLRESETASIELQIETHLFAATLLNKLGRYEEGLPHLDAVIRIDPNRLASYSQRAQLLAKLGEYDRAVEDLDRFLRLSDAPFEDPDIQTAFELRTQCEEAILERERKDAQPAG